MEVTAQSKNVRISTRKVRLIADAIRKLSIDDALVALRVSDKRAAGPLAVVIKSAVANAVNNNSLSRDNLVIESIIVNEGQALKRFHPSTRGRVHPYKRRASHITITLKEKDLIKSMKAVQPKAEAQSTKETNEPKGTKEKKGVEKK